MRPWLLLFSALTPITHACPALYSNYQYLTASQLALYNLTDPCTATCNIGYYGDFCQTVPTPPPPGPWNQAGYFLAGAPLVRTFTSLSVSLLYQAQFISGNNLMLALLNPRYPGTLVQVSYGAGTITPILTLPTGTLDALVVRGGVAYLARTQASGYDVITAAGQRLMGITSQARALEVFIDKGTATVFTINAAYQVSACYPNGRCTVWGTYNGATSVLCGIDCPGAVYLTHTNRLLRLTNTTATTAVQDTSTIYCAAADRTLNVLVYKSADGLIQVSLATGGTTTLLGLPSAAPCSLDISDGYTQLMLMQGGTTTTLNALQQACGYGQTSPAIYANTSGLCAPCPAPPDNAFIVVGSATCDWQCNAGYVQSGSLCTLPLYPPCPAYLYQADGGCVPAAQPWAPKGRYLAGVAVSPQSTWRVGTSAPYLLAASGYTTYLAVSGSFYVAYDSSYALALMSLSAPKSGGTCATSLNNAYYLLQIQNGTLFAAFNALPSLTNCLWSLNASGARVTQTASWTLGAPVCSVAYKSAATTVYLIFCGQHYIAQLSPLSTLSPLAGALAPGYADGPLLQAAFNSPSTMVHHLARLYVADTKNCVIREVDLSRGRVRTVAGTAGLCQRVDGLQAGLAYPTNLTYSAYDGYLLFLDQSPSELNPKVRQFHAPTGRVQSIVSVPLNGVGSYSYLVGLPDSLLAGLSNYYVQVTASSAACPPGYSSLAGNAPVQGGCLACQTGYYSSESAGACLACSSPACGGAGQVLTPCQLDRDAYCSTCSNKPSGGTVYTGPSTVPANASGWGGDCPWTYLPPCPPGYYQASSVCSPCPQWSTTAITGATSVAQCACMAGGAGAGESCVIPSPFALMPEVCGPLVPCPDYTEPAFPFPLLESCQYLARDSPLYVCPCPSGEYIQQIYPKVCAQCPNGLYSPAGRGCLNCPYLTEPSLDRSACRCALGTWDAAPVGAPQCMCGPGRRLDAQGCGECPKNTYSAQMVPAVLGASLECEACPAGTVSQAGATACTPCPFGEFKGDDACQNCPTGSYAPDPASPDCVPCVPGCDGLKERACPTDASLMVCSECDPARSNSFRQGANCATACLDGFYELDYLCTPCTAFDASTCPAGNKFVPCASYADAGCVPCADPTMPLNYAEWAYTPAYPGGPNAQCVWRCVEGYSAQRPPLPEGVAPRWECVGVGTWSVWDLFTV